MFEGAFVLSVFSSEQVEFFPEFSAVVVVKLVGSVTPILIEMVRCGFGDGFFKFVPCGSEFWLGA
jgi:hypothetical protein